MIILEIIILLLGLAISIVTLTRDDIKKNPFLKKGLSVLYIILFVISIIVLFTRKSEDANNKILLFETLGKIAGSVEIQSDSIKIVLERTINLGEKLDSLNEKTKEAIIQREQSQKIFSEQNRLLNKANELTEKQIEEQKPFIEVFSFNVKFDTIATSKTKLTIAFSNVKNRPAQNFQHDDLIVFKNKNGTSYDKHLHYPSDGIKRIVQKSNPIQVTHEINLKYEELLKIIDESILLITLKFQDEITSEYSFYNILFELNVKDNLIIANLEKPHLMEEINNYINLNNIEISIKNSR